MTASCDESHGRKDELVNMAAMSGDVQVAIGGLLDGQDRHAPQILAAETGQRSRVGA